MRGSGAVKKVKRREEPEQVELSGGAASLIGVESRVVFCVIFAHGIYR